MHHSLTKSVLQSLPPKVPSETTDFVNLFFSRVPDEEKDQLDPVTATHTAMLHLQLSKKREAGKPAINIHTPSIDDKGWDLNHTVIDIVHDDMAFLVDSVVSEIVRQKQTIHFLIHPILRLERTKTGSFKCFVEEKTAASQPQSHMHIQLKGVLTQSQINSLEEGLIRILQDVDYATADWMAMRNKLRDAQKAISKAPKKYSDALIEEYQAFLEYIYDNNFTLLGYREYKFTIQDKTLSSKTVKGSGLGLLRDDIKPVYINEAHKGLTEKLQSLRQSQEPVSISKVNKKSTVHRPVPMDAVAVKTYDDKGNVTGELLFIGLFTSVTYSRSVADIPYLRLKVQKIVDRSKFEPNTHDYKTLRHILEKYPRDELFQISEDSLFKHTIGILRLQERPRIALYMRVDPFGRYISCLVYVPRDRFETRIRLKFTQILEQELGGRCVNFMVTQDDSPLSRVMFLIDINHLSKVPTFNLSDIEQKLVDAGSLWADRVRTEFENEIKDEIRIAALIEKFGSAFPLNYQEKYSLKQATRDTFKVEEVLKSGRIGLSLFRPSGASDDIIRLKVYHVARPIPLSDIIPILENMGLKIISELPYEVQPLGETNSVWMHDFHMQMADANQKIDPKEAKDVFEEALTRLWHEEMENDGLNRLVLTAQMPWRHCVLLRTYVRYLRQTKVPYSREYIEKALTSHPNLSALLFKLFDAMLNPVHGEKSDMLAAGFAVEIDHALEKVTSLDFDRIIRSMRSLIEATLRTNFYQLDESGQPKKYISVKIKSGALEELPNPKPYREIFVYSPRVEGIHLRGDVISRGGIRWSDRHEDFRTEVLGLMKAQMVKNSVIVPMGAKGGFVVKQPPKEGGRPAYLAEGIECYKIFIRGLLDITDNRAGEKITRPKHVVCRDEEDPYLVVAADKGTATFSDIANALSIEYGHWLGDGFASGGSAGYDHKVMGITAKGAWESVKRHFRELNHDIQTQPFDVIGVGDMGGDVFGNGMLLSEQIHLIGAFNHQHIFCDPTPDAASSFAERARLFREVKGWDHYNVKLLSKGGRIYDRAEKSLQLTPEIQKRFDLPRERVSPNELIRALLRARTDLLWFGGIGTYVKATDENHTDVSDKANDANRVDATELRAKVLGEGANLAMTQKARIEFAQNGGKLNTDFIDNSGGVDSSDHEVNIKILLTDIMRKPKHEMDLKARNKLLAKMTDEVAAHVLRHNYQQSQAISLIELNAAEQIGAHAELIVDLEKRMGLDRKLEYLPTPAALQTRQKNGKGLTRPEIAVLVSYAKIQFTKDLLKTDIPELKYADKWVMDYFPKPLRENYIKEIEAHQLRRELVATMMANGIINRMGPTFVQGRKEKCRVTCAEVAKAYITVREAFGLRALWDQIESLDNKVPAQVQLKALSDIQKMTERAVTWFLTRLGRDLNVDREIGSYKDGIATLKKTLDRVLTPSLMNSVQFAVQRSVGDGLPKELAHQIALMPLLASACDIIRIALEQKAEISAIAQIYFEVGEHFHLDWMRAQAKYLAADDSWTQEALEGLVQQLYISQAGLTLRILKDLKKGGSQEKSKATPLQQWLSVNGEQADSLAPLFTELRNSAGLDLSKLVIAEQRLRTLCA